MLGVIFGLHHKLKCEEGNLRDKHKLYTLHLMMRGVEIEGLRVLHTLLLGVIILKLCYKNKDKEEGRERGRGRRRGRGTTHLHTHDMRLQFPKI